MLDICKIRAADSKALDLVSRQRKLEEVIADLKQEQHIVQSKLIETQKKARDRLRRFIADGLGERQR